MQFVYVEAGTTLHSMNQESGKPTPTAADTNFGGLVHRLRQGKNAISLSLWGRRSAYFVSPVARKRLTIDPLVDCSVHLSENRNAPSVTFAGGGSSSGLFNQKLVQLISLIPAAIAAFAIKS